MRTRSLVVVPLLAALVFGGGAGASAHPGTAGPAAAGCAAGSATLFCEDFDSLPLGGASTLDWGVDTRNGTLTVERAPAAPGGQLLHVRTIDNGRAFMRVDDLAVPGDRLFGRMRMRVDAFPHAPDWAHFTLVEATGQGSTEVVRPLGGQFVPLASVKGSLWGIGADGGPTGDWTDWRESAPATDRRWRCVEWELDAVDDRVNVWFDGAGTPALTASRDAHGGNDVPFVLPSVSTVKIGWQLYQGGTTPGQFDTWIDDVALGTNRLGC